MTFWQLPARCRYEGLRKPNASIALAHLVPEAPLKFDGCIKKGRSRQQGTQSPALRSTNVEA